MDSLNLEILLSVRNNLSNPSSWTQGAIARNESGKAVHYRNKHCTSRCLRGEILFCLYKKLKRSPPKSKLRAIEALIEEAAGFCNTPYFNDYSSHREMLKGLDKAIKLAEKEIGEFHE